MTEDEAKTKWCPFALAVRGDRVSGYNRGTDLGPDIATFCIASACMMWVTTEGHNKQGDCGLKRGG